MRKASSLSNLRSSKPSPTPATRTRSHFHRFKAFMGKDFVDKMNNAMDQGQSAMDGVNQMNWLAQSGLEASAEVISVADTGATVNMNPVVSLKLMVTPSFGVPFETTGNTMVSRIAVPRAGDTIKIKYNPADPTQFVVM